MVLERRLKPSVAIDMTPLIDVVFQLVIFFMITSVFKTTPGIPLDLPSSSTVESTVVGELRIVVRSDDEIWVGKERTTRAGLEASVRTALEGAARAETVATVEGDKEADFDLMVAALDALRLNGVASVSLVARQVQPGTEAPPSPGAATEEPVKP